MTRSFANGKALPFLLVIILVTFYACTIAPRIIRAHPLPFDTFRDVASARSMLNGRGLFTDPAIKGEREWYSPLNPIVFAGLARMTGVDVAVLYSYSPLFINVWSPLLFYILVLLLFDHRRAFIASLLLLIMPWLKTHLLTMGMPSIHAVTISLGVLVVTVVFYREGRTWKRNLLLGLLIGLALLHHSLSGMIVYASCCLSVLTDRILKRDYRNLAFELPIIAVPPVIAAPYLLPNLLRAKLNMDPLQFIASSFSALEYYFFIPNRAFCIFFWAFFLVGVVGMTRLWRRPGMLLVLCGLVVTMAGQLLGAIRLIAYARPETLGWLAHLPCVLPHEFQWFFQLLAVVPVTLGLSLCAHYISSKRAILLEVILALLLILPGYRDLLRVQMSYLVLHIPPERAPYISWIINNTPADAVFVTSHDGLAYREVQPFTGRPILFHYAAHMNFNVDVKHRWEQKVRLLFYANGGEARRIKEAFAIDYVLLWKAHFVPERTAFFRENFAAPYEDDVFAVFDLNSPLDHSMSVMPRETLPRE